MTLTGERYSEKNPGTIGHPPASSEPAEDKSNIVFLLLQETNGDMAAALANVETVEGIFSAIEAFVNEDLVKQVKGVFCFDVKGLMLLRIF